MVAYNKIICCKSIHALNITTACAGRPFLPRKPQLCLYLINRSPCLYLFSLDRRIHVHQPPLYQIVKGDGLFLDTTWNKSFTLPWKMESLFIFYFLFLYLCSACILQRWKIRAKNRGLCSRSEDTGKKQTVQDGPLKGKKERCESTEMYFNSLVNMQQW